MSVLMALVVLYGFSRTVDETLTYPTIPRPLVLYVHAAVFSGGWTDSFFLGAARDLIVLRRVHLVYLGAL